MSRLEAALVAVSTSVFADQGARVAEAATPMPVAVAPAAAKEAAVSAAQPGTLEDPDRGWKTVRDDEA